MEASADEAVRPREVENGGGGESASTSIELQKIEASELSNTEVAETTGAASTQGRERKVQRIYHTWQGRERFFFWGHCITGPAWWSIFGTCVLLALPSVMFIVFVARPISDDLVGGYAFLGITIACALLNFAFLFSTGCMDPGIIPRNPPPVDERPGQIPRTREVEVNGHLVVVRYNETCHFYQPPRAHHCSVIDDCIERFDHYCPWVGTTIGKRNYRFYLLFVFTSSLLCLYMFAFSAYAIHLRATTDNLTAGQAIAKEPAALFVMIFTFIAVWFVGGLSAFHIYLVSTNQTTYENIRYSFDRSRANPYDRGCFLNWAEVCCVRVPACNLNFRAEAPAGDVEEGVATDPPGVMPGPGQEPRLEGRTGSQNGGQTQA